MKERLASHTGSDDRALREALEVEQSRRKAAEEQLAALVNRTVALESELVRLREQTAAEGAARRLAFANEVWAALAKETGMAIVFAVILFLFLAFLSETSGWQLAAWAFVGLGYGRLGVVANEHAERLAQSWDGDAAVKAERSGVNFMARLISYAVGFSPIPLFFLFLKICGLLP